MLSLILFLPDLRRGLSMGHPGPVTRSSMLAFDQQKSAVRHTHQHRVRMTMLWYNRIPGQKQGWRPIQCCYPPVRRVLSLSPRDASMPTPISFIVVPRRSPSPSRCPCTLMDCHLAERPYTCQIGLACHSRTCRVRFFR